MTRVLLVGLMGAGKSTVAQAVAGVTGWPCLDNDALLERSTGSTAAQLLVEHGVERLRRAESDVLTLLLSMPGPFVAGVAAGTILDEGDRVRMRQAAHVVWLRATVPTLVRRVAKQGGRAWLDDDPRAVLTAMSEQRSPLYAQTCHQELDMDRMSPAGAAREIVAVVRAS